MPGLVSVVCQTADVALTALYLVRASPAAAAQNVVVLPLAATAPMQATERGSSWGGGGFYDAGSGLWLLWVSEMAGGCRMATWYQVAGVAP